MLVWFLLLILPVGVCVGLYMYISNITPSIIPSEDVVEKMTKSKGQKKTKSKTSRSSSITCPKTTFTPTSKWFKTSISGHTYALTAFAVDPTGNYVATASSDRSIRISSPNLKTYKISIAFDHVTAMAFNSIGKLLVCVTMNDKVIVYNKIHTTGAHVFREFPIQHEKLVHSVVVNDIGEWTTIITCAGDQDTNIKFWNLHGECVQVLNSNQVCNYRVVGSPDNRFISLCAYTSDVRIFQLIKSKTGEFQKIQRVMALRGHARGVSDLAFFNSTQLVTACKDGKIRLWNINVRFEVDEDPKLLKTFDAEDPYDSIAISNDGKLLVAARETRVAFINVESMQVFETIENATESPINRVEIAKDGESVYLYSTKSKALMVYNIPCL